MQKRKTLGLVLGALAMSACAVDAAPIPTEGTISSEITGGFHDTVSTGVGTLWGYFDWEDEGEPFWDILCTGFLVAPDVFITAAHCTFFPEEFGVPIAVSFAEEITFPPNGPLYSGTGHYHPGFAGDFTDHDDPSLNDVGLVVLDTPIYDRPLLKLPSAGQFDEIRPRMQPGSPLWITGFGLQVTDDGELVPTDERRTAPVAYEYHNETRIIASNLEEARGERGWRSFFPYGGTCFGDSGGPVRVFDRGRVVTIGVQSTGDCVSITGVDRLDDPTTRAFLADFVALP